MNNFPFKQRLSRRIKTAIANSTRTHDLLTLHGRIASMTVRTMRPIESLQQVEFRVFSQFGEDGIIDWLVETAAIPPHLQTFVEFGVERYREANTRFLLQNRNWKGLILDSDSGLSEELQQDSIFWQHDLTVKTAFINRENINELLTQAGYSGELGLLSIDIDGNDYWVWESLNAARPVICICEFNAVFGDVHAVSIPYDPNFLRSRAHSSHLYFGASIKAMCSLAAKKGYSFVGTTSAGNDAFFVRDDYAPRVMSALKNKVACCSRTRESRDQAGRLSYVGGRQRLELIAGLPVVQVDTGKQIALRDLHPLCTPEWI
jgi:hypothetical protein